VEALAAVGFCNLTEAQAEVIKVVPGISARIARALGGVASESLPSSVAIYSYFEKQATGRQLVSFRLYKPRNALLVRLEVVAPSEQATPEEMLEHFLAVWSEMVSRLQPYLARRHVPANVARQVVQALTLPAA
jgi:hypothetical protein